MALTEVILLSLKHLRAASVSASDRPQSSALMISIVTRQNVNRYNVTTLQRYNVGRSEVRGRKPDDGDQLRRSGRSIAVVRQQTKSSVRSGMFRIIHSV